MCRMAERDSGMGWNPAKSDWHSPSSAVPVRLFSHLLSKVRLLIAKHILPFSNSLASWQAPDLETDPPLNEPCLRVRAVGLPADGIDSLCGRYRGCSPDLSYGGKGRHGCI